MTIEYFNMTIDMHADCQSISVDVPVAEVYRRCLRFEELPRFLTSIKKINRINDTGFSCTSMLNGRELKSVVAIIKRVPERRLAWQSLSDNFDVGVILFDPLPGGSTKVTVKIRSITEPVRLTGGLCYYLWNFKRFLEEEFAGCLHSAGDNLLCGPHQQLY